MVVAYDNSVKVSSNSIATTLESAAWAISGSDRYLLVFVGSGAGGPLDPTAVKWGGASGTALTQKGTTFDLGVNGKWSCWELVNPVAQSATVYVSWQFNQDERWSIAVSFTGVDQTTPTRTLATNAGTNTAPTVTATSVSGDVVVDGVAFLDTGGDSQTLTVGGGQTSRQEIEGAALVFEGAGCSTEPATGTSVTMAWTISGTGPFAGWGIFAMALIAAAGGGGGTSDMTSTLRAGFRRTVRPRPFAPGLPR